MVYIDSQASPIVFPLVNMEKAMGNHHCQWVNALFPWPFSIVMALKSTIKFPIPS